MSIDFTFTGKELARAGAKLAEDHAEAEHLGWKDLADGYLLEFLSQHKGKFLAEQVREFSYARGLPRPSSERAWGGVMMHASSEDKRIIKWAGHAQVSNRRAHSATAALWEAF